MPSPQFEDFCRRLCEGLAVAPPALQPSGDTPGAYSLDFKGVCMVLAEAGSDAQGAAQTALVVDFGAVPEDRQAQVHPALLQANFMMLAPGAPTFGLHPVSASVTCQIVFGLDRADPLAWCGVLDGIAAAVLQWRETYGLAPPCDLRSAPHSPAHAMRA